MPPPEAARAAAGVNAASQPWSDLWRSTKSRASTSEPPSSPALPRIASTTSGASGCNAESCRAMRRARAASSRRSGSPIAQRGPASSRMRAEPALGSLITRSAETTSTTSGRREEPAETQDPMRDAATAERVAEADHVLLAAEEDGTCRAPASGAAFDAHALEPSAPRGRPRCRDRCRSRTPPRRRERRGERGALPRARRPTPPAVRAPRSRHPARARCCASWSAGEYCADGMPGENAAAKPPRLPALAPRQP